MRFYVDFENFIKKYWNPIEFYCFEQNQFREHRIHSKVDIELSIIENV